MSHTQILATIELDNDRANHFLRKTFNGEKHLILCFLYVLSMDSGCLFHLVVTPGVIAGCRSPGQVMNYQERIFHSYTLPTVNVQGESNIAI